MAAEDCQGSAAADGTATPCAAERERRPTLPVELLEAVVSALAESGAGAKSALAAFALASRLCRDIALPVLLRDLDLTATGGFRDERKVWAFLGDDPSTAATPSAKWPYGFLLDPCLETPPPVEGAGKFALVRKIRLEGIGYRPSRQRVLWRCAPFLERITYLAEHNDRHGAVEALVRVCRHAPRLRVLETRVEHANWAYIHPDSSVRFPMGNSEHAILRLSEPQPELDVSRPSAKVWFHRTEIPFYEYASPDGDYLWRTTADPSLAGDDCLLVPRPAFPVPHGIPGLTVTNFCLASQEGDPSMFPGLLDKLFGLMPKLKRLMIAGPSAASLLPTASFPPTLRVLALTYIHPSIPPSLFSSLRARLAESNLKLLIVDVSAPVWKDEMGRAEREFWKSVPNVLLGATGGTRMVFGLEAQGLPWPPSAVYTE
ncbi:hypothetical protein DFJ74DRAFT_296612 [Hyaloraphidium curvatum]|nr:hypothetical protein DFJ74DRAFT_296612 [Hyaloraphidium curvatum]